MTKYFLNDEIFLKFHSKYTCEFQENDGNLVLSWPQGEMARARLEDIWENLVGDDSTLHLRIEPQNRSILSNELPKRFQRQRTDREPLVVPNLKRGACYKVRFSLCYSLPCVNFGW